MEKIETELEEDRQSLEKVREENQSSDHELAAKKKEQSAFLKKMTLCEKSMAKKKLDMDKKGMDSSIRESLHQGTLNTPAKSGNFLCNGVMLWSGLLFLCSIIITLYFAHVQPTTAQITAPWEVDALRAIKGSLLDPLGRLNSWNRGVPCVGNWSRVICYNATASDGYFHVQELQLLQLNLSGTLAPELGQFSHMKIMDFMWNSISGSIPKEVGNITSLELLLLNGNQLSGSVPEEIGFLPNLNRIQIDQNHISGSIP